MRVCMFCVLGALCAFTGFVSWYVALSAALPESLSGCRELRHLDLECCQNLKSECVLPELEIRVLPELEE